MAKFRPIRRILSPAGSLLLLPAFLLFIQSAAAAGYRDTVSVLRIGMIDSYVTADPVRLEAIRSAYASALGISVEIVRFPNYSALIDAHASARVAYAIHTARSFAATEAVCGCIRALRRPVASDGTAGFRSVLVVRNGAKPPYGKLRIAFSNRDSVSGWEIPALAIQSGSLEAPRFHQSGSIAGVAADFADGKVDGFFGWIPDKTGGNRSGVDQIFGGRYAEELASGGTMQIVWSSEPIPFGPHAIHRSVPEDLAAALGAFLDTMPRTLPELFDILEPVYSGGYVEADSDDYRGLQGLGRFLPQAEGDGSGN